LTSECCELTVRRPYTTYGHRAAFLAFFTIVEVDIRQKVVTFRIESFSHSDLYSGTLSLIVINRRSTRYHFVELTVKKEPSSTCNGIRRTS
jgi:hypothetical protein